MKDMLKETLKAELSEELGYEKHEKDVVSENSRNGYFESKIVPKYYRDISNLEENVISMYVY